MKVTVDSIIADLRKATPHPLLLLHGDDLKVRSGAKSLVDILVPEENRAFNLERFDGRTASWDEIEAALMTAPFFPGSKIVWVENAPYFASAENKGEMGEKIVRLWSEGKKDEAARALVELLTIEGWTEERWKRAEARADAPEVAGLLGEGAKDAAEPLLAYARAQNLEMRRGHGEVDRLIELLDKGPPPWGVLLLAAAHVDRRTRLYKKFADQGAVVDLTVERDRGGRIDRATLAQFIDRKLAEGGKRIEPRAKEMILARAGTQLWSFHQELEKLMLYVGAAPTISAEDVEKIVIDEGEGWIFDLTDALIARNTVSALSQVSRLLAQGNHPLALLGPIASAIRRLLIARQFMDEQIRRSRRRMTPDEVVRSMPDELTALLSSPKAAYHCVVNAQNFTAKKLLGGLELIYETDLRLKSSGPSPRIIMERLILDLCSR
jgi:DNA polymerase III subunit delta